GSAKPASRGRGHADGEAGASHLRQTGIEMTRKITPRPAGGLNSQRRRTFIKTQSQPVPLKRGVTCNSQESSHEASHFISFRERDHGCSPAQGALLHDG